MKVQIYNCTDFPLVIYSHPAGQPVSMVKPLDLIVTNLPAGYYYASNFSGGNATFVINSDSLVYIPVLSEGRVIVMQNSSSSTIGSFTVPAWAVGNEEATVFLGGVFFAVSIRIFRSSLKWFKRVGSTGNYYGD